VSIEVFAAEQSAMPVDTIRWMRLARSVLEAEGVRGDAELSMVFVDEAAIADLNKSYRGADGPTDVLAFPMDEEAVEGGRFPDSGGAGPGRRFDPDAPPGDMPVLIGDVVICPAVADRNAPTHAGSYEDEMALLVVHGILHLLGMDHADEEEARTMERRERELLEQFHRTSR
jgi:probable rRNA maturation factor